jgi:hypothetical protein
MNERKKRSNQIDSDRHALTTARLHFFFLIRESTRRIFVTSFTHSRKTNCNIRGVIHSIIESPGNRSTLLKKMRYVITRFVCTPFDLSFFFSFFDYLKIPSEQKAMNILFLVFVYAVLSRQL